jgi:hypothetical protein
LSNRLWTVAATAVVKYLLDVILIDKKKFLSRICRARL